MSRVANSFVTGTLEYLRRPLVANIGRGKRVLVLSDFDHDPRVWQAVMTILSDLGADATLALFERRYVQSALVRAGGNVAEAARVAGLDRSNFRRLLRRLGVTAAGFRPDEDTEGHD